MANRPTSGDQDQQQRDAANAREQSGVRASEAGASTGASQQRKKVNENASHEEKLEGKNKNKQESQTRDKNEARPRSRDNNQDNR
jgi:hypothetical protein